MWGEHWDLDQNTTGGSALLPTGTAHLWYHSSSGGLKTAHTSIDLSDFLQVWGNPAHIARYYLNSWFSCPALELLSVQEGKLLFLSRLQGSLELLRAPNESQCPIPNAPHTAALSCLSPSVLSSFWPAHPTPATFLPPWFFPVINNYLSLLPLMACGRGSLMSLWQLKP